MAITVTLEDKSKMKNNIFLVKTLLHYCENSFDAVGLPKGSVEQTRTSARWRHVRAKAIKFYPRGHPIFGLHVLCLNL